MRQRIFEASGLKCSAGIAPTRMIAKIASDYGKPDGQHLIANTIESVLAFLRPLSIRKVPGVGKVTERILKEGLGIQTIQDLYDMREKVTLCMSRSAEWLLAVAMGIPGADRPKSQPRKSISCERTFR